MMVMMVTITLMMMMMVVMMMMLFLMVMVVTMMVMVVMVTITLARNKAGPGRTRCRTRQNGEDVSGETRVFFEQNQAGPGRTRPDQVPDQAWIPRKLQAKRTFSSYTTRPDQAGPGTGPGGMVRTSQAKPAFLGVAPSH